MGDSAIEKSTADSGDRQERDWRTEQLRGVVTSAEFEEVDKALTEAGFRSMSEGVRTLSLLFARLPEMRALVAQHRIAA
jgi:hypothetical protein